jgi:hypothetical protein
VVLGNLRDHLCHTQKLRQLFENDIGGVHASERKIHPGRWITAWGSVRECALKLSVMTWIYLTTCQLALDDLCKEIRRTRHWCGVHWFRQDFSGLSVQSAVQPEGRRPTVWLVRRNRFIFIYAA